MKNRVNYEYHLKIVLVLSFILFISLTYTIMVPSVCCNKKQEGLSNDLKNSVELVVARYNEDLQWMIKRTHVSIIQITSRSRMPSSA